MLLFKNVVSNIFDIFYKTDAKVSFFCNDKAKNVHFFIILHTRKNQTTKYYRNIRIMLKRILLIFLFALTLLPSHAVLKEDSLSNTLAILRTELVKYHDEYSARHSADRSRLIINQLIETMQLSNQNELMLYSQKDGYVFDLTYACHEAIGQYEEFEKHLVPFKSFVNKADGEVARYDSLINCLRSMPIMMLDEKAKIDRNVCLTVAVNTRRMLIENQQQLSEYIYYYERTEKRLKQLNDYAQERYNDIQNSIFKNGGENYLTIISRFGYYLSQTKESVGSKYTSNKKVKSQWDARLIFGLFGIIIIYGIIAILLNQLIVRWLVTKLIKKGKFANVSEWFLSKRKFIIMTSTVVTFALILGVVSIIAVQNFIIMASGLLVEYAWLLSVILISLLIRVKAEQNTSTFKIYAPLLLNGFIVISFRIILIPNDLVNLIFPPILLACCFWQWRMISKYKKQVDKMDVWFAIFSQVVFIISLTSAVIGYTLLSVQILIWWIMQLTCILTITCIRDWYKEYSKHSRLKEMPITKTWHHRLFYWVFLPSGAVLSLLVSLYWAADVFNLSELTKRAFSTPFIDIDGFTVSIFGICKVVIMWFIFNYINHTTKKFIALYFERIDPSSAASRLVMVKNVLQVVVWGVWFLLSLAIFHVSNRWLVIITGGLSTGVGFASKDILENIYYGISLMAGRIKIGDLIVCDGIRGTVTSISYTSTMVTATDGSVIAFTNSQLFTKNYKNMTRNHGYECHILDVGVAYGTNVSHCKKVLSEALLQLDCINKEKGVNIVLKELGDSALVLKVMVWVSVYTQYTDDGIILECIYNTLNNNKIEIPFPQTDVHLRS